VSRVFPCVGRTIYIGYYDDEPEQRIMSSMLSIFIDERTGTSVKLVKLENRAQGFDYLRRDKVSILVDYAGNILDYLDESKGDRGKLSLFSSKRVEIAKKLKAVFVAVPGYDSSVSGAEGENLGKAFVILSKKSLSRFPAMPRLLKKLAGRIDNGVMALFIREIAREKPDRVSRQFLKRNKLI
jgi:glycine betaine/choline ABC-type transport system substrate-binding protein